MNLVARVKNILITPQTEWPAISLETETPQSLLFKYVIPLSLIPAVCTFIGTSFFNYQSAFGGFGGLRFGLILGISQFVISIIAYYLCSYIVDAVGPSFSSPKNIGKSAQLVAYSYTASWVVGIFYLLPVLGILAILGLYSIYLFYMGIPVMKHTPEDKRIIYMLVCAGILIVVSIVVQLVIRAIVLQFLYTPYM